MFFFTGAKRPDYYANRAQNIRDRQNERWSPQLKKTHFGGGGGFGDGFDEEDLEEGVTAKQAADTKRIEEEEKKRKMQIKRKRKKRQQKQQRKQDEPQDNYIDSGIRNNNNKSGIRTKKNHVRLSNNNNNCRSSVTTSNNDEDWDDSEDEEFFDDIEGDFSTDDALYFRNLSLQSGVGTVEQASREEKIRRREEKKRLAEEKKKAEEEAILNGDPIPTLNSNSIANDERPSSQGFMFLPPAVAKEAEALQAEQKNGIVGDSGMNKNRINESDLTNIGGFDSKDDIGAADSKDVWTWDDIEDGGGDGFFGNSENSRAEEDFFLTGAVQQSPQQPKPPKSMPPSGMQPSPMQKRRIVHQHPHSNVYTRGRRE